jgi:hypothetical protein
MKKLKIFVFVFCFSIVQHAISQDTVKYWSKGAFTSLTFTQVNLTNWAAGGENAFSGMAMVNAFANYKKDKNTWDNTLDLGYGVLKSGDQSIRKNDDKIDFNSKYGRLAFDKVYYSAMLNFKSQFQPGYNYPNDSVIVSKFLSPAYITVAIGMDYKPIETFSLFVSPVTGILTIVADQKLADSAAYGVDPGKHVRHELGAYIRARFQSDIGVKKNINVLSTLNLFDNYTDKNKSNRTNVDLNWETMVSVKLGKYLTTSFFFHLIYDNDILLPNYKTINGVETEVGKSPKLQIKEVIGFGISYKFSS